MVVRDGRGDDVDIAEREQAPAKATAIVEVERVVVADRAVVDTEPARRECTAAEPVRSRIRFVAAEDSVVQLEITRSKDAAAPRRRGVADRLAINDGDVVEPHRSCGID